MGVTSMPNTLGSHLGDDGLCCKGSEPKRHIVSISDLGHGATHWARHTVSDLEPGQEYAFSIRAVNAAGAGDDSEVSWTVCLPEPEEEPPGVSSPSPSPSFDSSSFAKSEFDACSY